MQQTISIIAWILWVLVGLAALFALALSLLPGDPGGRWIFGVQGLIWATGVVITPLLSFSKFHLLWIVPVGAVAPFAIMNWRARRGLKALHPTIGAAVIRDAFTAARNRYEESQRSVSPYTKLARDRAAVKRAQVCYKENPDSHAYKEEVASFTDEAAFASFTVAELDDYAIRIETLAVAFDASAAAFVNLDSAAVDREEKFYVEAAACFNFYSESYRVVIDSYKIAALVAKTNAAELRAEAVRDYAKSWIFEQEREDNDEIQRNAALANAEFHRTSATEKETAGLLLEQKAKAAEITAESLLSQLG